MWKRFFPVCTVKVCCEDSAGYCADMSRREKVVVYHAISYFVLATTPAQGGATNNKTSIIMQKFDICKQTIQSHVSVERVCFTGKIELLILI